MPNASSLSDAELMPDLSACTDSAGLLAPDSTATDDYVQQIEALKRVYIIHPRVEPVAEALDRVVKYGVVGKEEGSPARCVLITGDSGSGKTTLLHWWSAQHKAKTDGLKDRRPVIYVEVPPNCTIKALSEEMLRQLGVPERVVAKGTETTLGHRVKHHLKEQEVQLVILDEVQHLIDRRSQKVVYKVADFVKGLVNSRICPFVLCGTPEARSVYSENTQLKRRTFFRRPILPYDWNVQEQQDGFRRVLHAFEQNLPFTEPSQLASKQIALRIHRVSDGLIGRAVDFLVMATIRALEANAPCLTLDVLRETVDDMWDGDDPDWYNPFDPLEVGELQKPKVAGATSRVTRLHRRDRQVRQADVLPS